MTRLERLSAGDHTTLVTDRGPAPMNIAAALVLEGATSPHLGTVRDLLDERLVLVPRLRQRLLRPPAGCGRPVWVDDGDFATDRHLSARTAHSEAELLSVSRSRLPGSGPSPWTRHPCTRWSQQPAGRAARSTT